jgi:hypothetical protein
MNSAISVEPVLRTRKETVYEDIKKRVSYDGLMRSFVERVHKLETSTRSLVNFFRNI